MSNQVIIQNAVKRYGDFTALNGVSLDIQAVSYTHHRAHETPEPRV